MAENLDLMCNEGMEEERGAQIALVDQYSRQPEKLKSLLHAEQHVQCPFYLDTVQQGLMTAKDREMVLLHLQEVLVRLSCSIEQLQVTICLFDRYLSKQPTQKTELNGICMGCLLMASKVLGGNLHCKDVARAGGLQARTLKDYELEVAKGLGWDGTTVTPVEFIYELLSQLLSQQSIPNDLLPQLYTNSAQISTQLVLDSSKLGTPVSTLASVSLMLSVHIICPTLFDDILRLVLSITDTELDSFSEYYRTLYYQVLAAEVPSFEEGEGAKGCGSTTPTTATTPSDARDVVDMFK